MSSFLFGYIDTGTGSLVIQALIGVVAGVGVFGRRFFGTVKDRLKSLFSGSDTKQK